MLNEPRILILAIGNRSRGDDGVAPILLERLAARINRIANAEFIIEEVYQLQPEHIYDMEIADAVLIVDAATDLDANIRLGRIKANKKAEVGTHTVSPGNLLGLYQNLLRKPPPPSFLLSIKASEFGFTEKLSCDCQRALADAESFVLEELANPCRLLGQVAGLRAAEQRSMEGQAMEGQAMEGLALERGA
ncbi:MAG: hydrogenase maturation protease [Pseudomonadales bacterium]